MKKKAEEILKTLREFVKDLDGKRKDGQDQKSKQLNVIQTAMKNLQQSSISIPDEMISLENRLKDELEQESHVISEIYDYMKNEIMDVFQVEDFSTSSKKTDAPAASQEQIKEVEEEIVIEKPEKPVEEKAEEKIEEAPKKKKIKKVIMNDDSQISMRPSFRFRQR